MNSAVLVETLEHVLPHRRPMIWVSEVLESDAEGGICLINTNKNENYFSSDGLRRSSLIEIIAQSFGYLMGHFKNSTKPLDKAFLVGIEDFQFIEFDLWPSENLVVKVKIKRVVGQVSFVEGSVSTELSKEVYGEGLIKLYSE